MNQYKAETRLEIRIEETGEELNFFRNLGDFLGKLTQIRFTNPINLSPVKEVEETVECVDVTITLSDEWDDEEDLGTIGKMVQRILTKRGKGNQFYDIYTIVVSPDDSDIEDSYESLLSSDPIPLEDIHLNIQHMYEI